MEIDKMGGDSAAYRKEIQEGVQIFEKSFKGVRETKDFPQKTAEYEKSIDESMQAIQDAATALMNKKLLEMKDQLDKDYHVYLDNPTAQNAEKVEKDLDSLRKSVQ